MKKKKENNNNNNNLSLSFSISLFLVGRLLPAHFIIYLTLINKYLKSVCCLKIYSPCKIINMLSRLNYGASTCLLSFLLRFVFFAGAAALLQVDTRYKFVLLQPRDMTWTDRHTHTYTLGNLKRSILIFKHNGQVSRYGLLARFNFLKGRRARHLYSLKTILWSEEVKLISC